jgi:hypothetical protein
MDGVYRRSLQRRRLGSLLSAMPSFSLVIDCGLG